MGWMAAVLGSAAALAAGMWGMWGMWVWLVCSVQAWWQVCVGRGGGVIGVASGLREHRLSRCWLWAFHRRPRRGLGLGGESQFRSVSGRISSVGWRQRRSSTAECRRTLPTFSLSFLPSVGGVASSCVFGAFTEGYAAVWVWAASVDQWVVELRLFDAVDLDSAAPVRVRILSDLLARSCPRKRWLVAVFWVHVLAWL